MRKRGEYKTPGGKLVAVEFSVREGEVRDFVLTGDFFLYPEEALPLLAQSLEGAPATRTLSEYSERVSRVLSNEISLVGTSPDGIAIAIERALDDDEEEGDRVG